MKPETHDIESSRRSIFVLAVLLCYSLSGLVLCGATQTPPLNSAPAGEATAAIQGDKLRLSNKAIEVDWRFQENGLVANSLTDRLTNRTVSLSSNAFVVTLQDGEILKSSEMRVTAPPRMEKLTPDPNASQLAARFGGWQIEVGLSDSANRLQVVWRAILRDGSSYVRQEVKLNAIGKDVLISNVRLVDLTVPGVRVCGAVKGSPIVAGNLFFGFEHPLSESRASGDRAFAEIGRELPLRAGQTVTYSSVIGVTAPGQLRRGFLAYLERERAHPYRTFLHYNSWYDIGFGKPYDAAAVDDVIGAIRTELVRKRGVKLDSFLLDDGWDNPHSTWQMNSGFPGGLAPLNRAAHEHGAAMGVWLSPWGGYEEAKRERIEFGRKNGFETNEGGFALSGPKYYARFQEVSLDFIEKDGVNQFKIDGTGNVDSVFAGSSFDSDFAAAISLIRDWRAKKPDLYVNLTTGTYPSPFWLRYADSIWRGGDDNSFAGVGSWREKWITYRDGQTYQNIVQAGPLFPLNSLMLHGLIYARQAEHLDSDPGNDFANEVHDYFGSGTQLQEMYISHALLSKNNWDVLAEAANWSRRNARTLRDTHWIGGDPGKLEVYGWAAWSRAKGILTLRNPSDQRQSISLDVGRVFELPPGAPRRFAASSPWKRDRATPPVRLAAGEEHVFTLEPFEVLTLETRVLTSGGKLRESRDQ